ncbi:MAG TPA: response regulator transcription factor [Noviherbaspirillum sp.]|nr:response regulator transcription factor [Noviherbaspirillum sp.]
MKILIVDDHALIREGIAIMIKRIEPQSELWQANSCTEALEIAATQAIDFVFLDLNLPDQPGFVALELFKERHALMPVVVVSAQEDRTTVLKALELGAKAFVPKSADSERMRNAIEVLLDGRVYLPESILGSDAPPHAAPGAPGNWSLTERQKEVLALIIMGLPNKLIARRLNIVESTVKIHVSAILRELKVASRTQALIAVAKYGIKLPML